MYSVGEECTQEVADLLERCIRTNVDERPNAKEIVAALQVSFFFRRQSLHTICRCYIWLYVGEVSGTHEDK